MELVFLSTFTIEIFIRIYAYGLSHFFDALNIVDAIIVFPLFILQIVIMTSLGDDVSGSLSFLRIVRLVRLVRLFVVMNKVQKAQRAYKKAKYLKLGSPVERVMELLGEMKRKIGDDEKEADDVADISWIMHLISSDKLYTIDIRAAGGGNLSSEMEKFLQDNMGMKKDIENDEEEDQNLATAAGLKRQETKVGPGSDSAAGKELAHLDDVLMLPEIEYYINEQPGGRPSRLHEWDIDLFDFAGKAQNYHLVAGVYQLLEDHGLINKFRLSKHRLLTYLHRIQDGYIAENPYHNSIHALDVSLNVNYFCRQKLMCDLITPLDRLAAIIGGRWVAFARC